MTCDSMVRYAPRVFWNCLQQFADTLTHWPPVGATPRGCPGRVSSRLPAGYQGNHGGLPLRRLVIQCANRCRVAGSPEWAHSLKSGAAKRQIYRGETRPNDGCAAERLPISPKRPKRCLARGELGHAWQASSDTPNRNTTACTFRLASLAGDLRLASDAAWCHAGCRKRRFPGSRRWRQPDLARWRWRPRVRGRRRLPGVRCWRRWACHGW